LLCFGAPKEVVQRFEELRENKFWDDVLHEPYLVFAIIFDELHDMFDLLSKKLGYAIRTVEEAAIKQARAPQQWALMHGAQKYVLPAFDFCSRQANTLHAGIVPS
jgi:hypothetical protein